MTSPIETYMQADRLAKAHPELTADDIRKMPMSDWARLTGREQLRPEIPLAQTPKPVEAPRVEIPEPEPVSVKNMTLGEYELYRAEIGMGTSTKNVGIFGKA